MKYVVEYTDERNGATSPIDNIDAPIGYTAEQYIEDCQKNADPEWNELFEHGDVKLVGYECPSEEVEETYGDYIATLEQDTTAKWEAWEWEAWIKKEAADHDEVIDDCVVDAIVEKLASEGYVID